MSARTRRNTQNPDQADIEARAEDQAVQADEAATVADAESVFSESPDVPESSDTSDSPEMDLAAALARIAQLEAEKAELSKRPVRSRTPKLTAKQTRFLRALHASPTATLADLVSASGAGGVTEPHGFVYRLIDHGYVTLVLADGMVDRFPAISDNSDIADTADEGDTTDESGTTDESDNKVTAA